MSYGLLSFILDRAIHFITWSNKSQSPLKRSQPDATQTQPSPATNSSGPCCEIRNLTGVTIMSGLLSAHSKYMVNGFEHKKLVISQPHSSRDSSHRQCAAIGFYGKCWGRHQAWASQLFIYLQVKTQIIKMIQTCKQLSQGPQGHPIITVVIL